MSTSERSEPQAGRPEDIKAVPLRRPGRWIAAAIVLVVVASFVRAVITNQHFQWGVVGHYLFDGRVLHGVLITLMLTVLSMIIGVALGVTLAIMRQSPNPIVSSASWLYIWFFRGTPLLLQIYFWYNITSLFPTIDLGIPFGPALIHAHGNAVVTTLVAALLGLGLNEGAYMAEIVRGGILAVGEGQGEAASSLGMSRLQTMRFVVLPQAMRVILPPTGNETISMLKNTSLVSVIAYTELLYTVQQIYDVTYQTIPLLIAAAIWYLAMTSVAYVGQYFIERRFGRGFSRAGQRRSRLLSFRFGRHEAPA